MADSSFDVVSKLDKQEVDNALNQTIKEVQQRYDFKGTDATIEWSGEGIVVSASSDDRVLAVVDVFQSKLIRRQVSIKVLDFDEPKPASKGSRLDIALKDGLSSDDAKKVAKIVRDEGPKGVKTQITGDEVRVSSKSRDDLQSVISLLKGKDLEFPVQFVNYR
ncbi:YajQ family cyclic di-GMP-binding protein [Micrococcales bacterium 31B]|nr:YajQ family cyclic di-GMP-binding protein [Micrococcales bacterium 31B]